jgi:hypothetical protein
MEALQDLDAEDVTRWAAWFDKEYQQLWDDVRRLVHRLSTDQNVDLAWHHVVMAVGNFKRQTPIEYFLPSLQGELQEVSTACVTVYFDERPIELDATTFKAWRKELTDVTGIGVPTATTILAALWPKEHAIFDRRVARSMTALQSPEQREAWKYSARADRTQKIPERDWPNYDVYLKAARATANALNVELQQLERALFMIDQEFKLDSSRSWDQLGEDMKARLHEEPKPKMRKTD